MAKVKYYFRSTESEMCYSLDYHLAEAKDKGLKEIELFEAIPEKVDGMFWCNSVNEMSEDGNCGKQCFEYKPKNGQSGMCQHKRNFWMPGEKKTFKVK